MNTKVVVTGATGFLGFNLAQKLSELNFAVTGLGRNTLMGEELQKKGIKFVKVDLSDSEKLTEVFNNAEFIFHCGAKSSNWGSYKSFFEANVTGTKNVVNACLKNNVKRLIHVSSPSIYFDYKDKFNIKEDEILPEKFVNNYAKTKFLAEKVVEKEIANGLDAIIIRPRAIMGIGDTAIIPRLIRANNEKFIPKTVEDDILIDVTFVQNVVEALILAMNADKKYSGHIYNITNGENIKFYETVKNIIINAGFKYNEKKIPYKKVMFLASFLEFIYKFIPNKEPVFTKYSAGLISFNQTLDITKAKNELGYKPVISIKDGFKELEDYFKKENVDKNGI